MASLVRSAGRAARVPAAHVRCLATPAKSFRETLDSGPSLDDFISGDTPDRVVLGNTSAYVARSTASAFAVPDRGAVRACRRTSRRPFPRESLSQKSRTTCVDLVCIRSARRRGVRISVTVGAARKVRRQRRARAQQQLRSWYISTL